MPWSITVSLIASVLVLCRLCDTLIKKLHIKMWSCCLFLFLLILSALLPSIRINHYITVKPYYAILFLYGASYLLARADTIRVLRAFISTLACTAIYLVTASVLPPEASPVLVSAFIIAPVCFVCAFTADAVAISTMLSCIISELTFSLMYLPYFEFGSSDFLDSTCISTALALILSRIFAHNALAERRRNVSDRVSHLPR